MDKRLTVTWVREGDEIRRVMLQLASPGSLADLYEASVVLEEATLRAREQALSRLRDGRTMPDNLWVTDSVSPDEP